MAKQRERDGFGPSRHLLGSDLGPVMRNGPSMESLGLNLMGLLVKDPDQMTQKKFMALRPTKTKAKGPPKLKL